MTEMYKRMKTFEAVLLGAVLLCGCHESLEQRAEREAREYTRKNCPTPVANYTRTDSVVFDVPTRTYHYYCSVVGDLDDPSVFDQNRDKLRQLLLQSVKDNTGFRAYKKEGFAFAWTLRSDKSPKTVYFEYTVTKKEYGSAG